MRLTKTFLAAAFIVGCVSSASAQRVAPKPSSDAPPVVTVGTRFEGQTITRVLRLEYQLRILAQYNPGAMRVHTVFPGGPATRVTLAGPQRMRGTLEPGDVITHVDGRRIYSRDDYYLAMYRAAARNGRVRLLVRDVNSGRYFTWDAVAEKVGGADRDRPLPRNARPATRVKALVIGLTNDRSSVGDGSAANVETLVRYLRGLPNFDPKTDLTLLTGNKVSARNILRTVAAMRVGPTETLFCYYAGHGAYDPNLAAGDPSGGHHFQIPSGDLMRKDLLNALRDKGAQLTVLISDTCNVRGLYTPPTLTSPLPTLPPPLRSKVFADLLYNYVGVVDVSGSTRNQYGWFTRDGGWFTLGLLTTLEKSTRTDGWSAFLEEMSKNVSAMFQFRKRAVLAEPEPKEEARKKTRQKLAAQKDQRPQTFKLTVLRVKD